MSNIHLNLYSRITRLSATEVADAAIKLFGYSENSKSNGANHKSKRQLLSIPTSIIRPANNQSVIFGPAFTVQIDTNGPSELQSGKIQRDQSKFHFSDAVQKDSVLVVSVPGNVGNAVFGGLMMTRLLVKGVSGMVTNGYVRDFVELRDGIPGKSGGNSILPIFAKGLSPLPPKPFTFIKDLQVPVPFPAIPVSSATSHSPTTTSLIHPGDFVLADANGVLIIPFEYQSRLDELVQTAEQIKAKEDKILAELKTGSSFASTMDKHKRF